MNHRDESSERSGASTEGRAPNTESGASGISSRRRLWCKRLLLLSFSLMGSLLTAEAAVRIVKPEYLGFRLPQVKHEVAPGLGFAMIPNQVGYTFAERVEINSHGFRGPELQKGFPLEGLRVICLGDSITYGVGVGDDVPFPRQLQEMLKDAFAERPVEVINTGTQRYFTYQEIDLLRQIKDELHPDVVVLAVYYNDLGERPQDKDFIRGYENERERVASSFRARAPWLYLIAKNSALLELAKKAYLSARKGKRYTRTLRGQSDESDERKWEAMKSELQAFRDLSVEDQFQPLVVTIPARAQVVKGYEQSLYPSRVLAICTELGLPAVNMLDTFVESLQDGTDPYLQWNDHMSPTGHRLVAEAVRDAIANDDGTGSQ